MPDLELFVPGRICLMGEHSDWAGNYRRFNKDIVPGACLVSGTNQGLYARVRSHPNKLIVKSVDHKYNTGSYLRCNSSVAGARSYSSRCSFKIPLY